MANPINFESKKVASLSSLYGAFSGHGHSGGGCKGKDDDNLLELLAIGIGLVALVQALMAGGGRRRRRRRRRREVAEEEDQESFRDLMWSWALSGTVKGIAVKRPKNPLVLSLSIVWTVAIYISARHRPPPFDFFLLPFSSFRF